MQCEARITRCGEPHKGFVTTQWAQAQPGKWTSYLLISPKCALCFAATGNSFQSALVKSDLVRLRAHTNCILLYRIAIRGL